MALYTISIQPYIGCVDGEISSLTVRASSADKVRALALEQLVEDGHFDLLSVFADPERSSVETLKVRGDQGVVDVTIHHCADHS